MESLRHSSRHDPVMRLKEMEWINAYHWAPSSFLRNSFKVEDVFVGLVFAPPLSNV